MKILPHVLAELEATTPSTADVQDRVHLYLSTSQMTMKELARRINYGANSLSIFMAGKYISMHIALTDVRLRRSLVDFMDAHPIEVQAGPEGKLYETSNVAVMRHWFTRCLDNREMAVVYGPPGAQKTFVLTHLMAEHNLREIPKNGHGTRAYYVYCSQGTTPRELLRKMARAAALPSAGTILGLLDIIRHHLRTRKALFVLDEAQHLGIPALEIARELNDCEPRCGILLSGSHSLMQVFEERAVELEQWNSRLTQAVPLPGITVTEATAIIEAELGQLPGDKVKELIEMCRVVDGFSKKKNHSYLSARRLFRRVHDIKSHPLFAQKYSASGATGEKESAA